MKEDGKHAATLTEKLKKYQRDQAAECTEKHRLLYADEHHAESDVIAVDHAALIAEAAELAATKVAAQVEAASKDAAAVRVDAAKEAAAVRVDAAKDAAVVLTNAADEAPKKFTRDQIVANFWILVGLLILTGVIGGIADQLIKLIFG